MMNLTPWGSENTATMKDGLRKNALFYKNEHWASVGAILQSLIETCRLAGARICGLLAKPPGGL
jgi:hypothetical protein